MTSEKLDEKAVFNIARKIASAEARVEYLHQICGSDERLIERVETLLSAYDAQASFLESPAVSSAAMTERWAIAEQPGTIIGPYKLLQQIGEGGMGVVFMAEQSEPIQRTVALKIIKPGMDTRQVIARFEAERQALALMDHPNIARVLDVGTTDASLPYFVMDLVKGVPITDYCDQQQLSIRERLELMANVCHAVQHAHQKGIIHRDLKPSNVLVAEYDGKPVPKIIDFGVAKATAQKLTERTMFTEYGQLIGTFEYMSPEQARLNQLDIDTRSDIYSLGVLLYELLAGSTPLEKERLRSAAFDEILRMIGEEEPPKPSTRLSSSQTLPSISAQRQSEPAKLKKLMQGELDWIVMKCLEKDRNRRYETANGFAADIQRHLDGEPIEARSANMLQRLTKWSRRNVAIVWSSIVILLISTFILAGASLRITKWYREAVKSAQLASVSAAESKAVVDFLVNDLLAAPTDEMKLDRDITVSEVLINSENKVAEALKDQPLVEATVRHGMAKSFQTLQKFDKAEPHARRALELRTRLLGPTHHDTLETTTTISEILVALGKPDEARQLCRVALEVTRRALGAEHVDTIGSMNRMVWLIITAGAKAPYDNDSAKKLCDETLDIALRTLGAEHRETLRATRYKALLLSNIGDNQAAEELLRNSLALSRKALGANDLLTLQLAKDVADTLHDRQLYLDAIELYEDVLERQSRDLGRKDPETLRTMKALGSAMQLLNRFEEARKLYEEGLEISGQLYGRNHGAAFEWKQLLVAALRGQGNLTESYKLQKEVLDWKRQNLGLEHRATLWAMHQLAYDLLLLDRFDESLALNDETIGIAKRVLEPDDQTLLGSMLNRARALRGQGKLTEARNAATEVVAAVRRIQSANPNSDLALAPRVRLARWLVEDGDYEVANMLIDETIEHLPPNDWYYRNFLAWFLVSCPRDEIRDGERALELATKAGELTEYKLAKVLDTLAAAYAETGDFPSALLWGEKAVEFATTPTNRELYAKHLESFRQGKPWRDK